MAFGDAGGEQSVHRDDDRRIPRFDDGVFTGNIELAGRTCAHTAASAAITTGR
jgi:hypothetical protein